MTRAVPADPWDGVPRLALPVLWVTAATWLALSYAVRGSKHLLVLAERLHAALGRALTRAGRSLLRLLGPLGRQLRRALRPVLARLRQARAEVGRALVQHVLVPLGRLVVTAWARSRPVRALLGVAVRRLLVRARPFLTVLAIMMSGLHTLSGTLARPLVLLGRRLVAQWRRLWAPVVRTARALRLLVAARFGPRRA